MTAFKCTHVEVYVFRRRRGRVEFLALRRAPERAKLPGVWQPVTGSLDRGERPVAAALREVREETGFAPRRWWALETLTTFYDPLANTFSVLPLFAAEVGADEAVELSDEHDAAKFVSAPAAARLFLWESQRRGLAAVRREVLAGGPLARALALPSPASHARPARRRARTGS